MKKKREVDSVKTLQRWGVAFVIFALLFAIAPIGIFKILAMQRDTTSWPSIQGTVIVCEIDHRVNNYADEGEEDEYRVDLVYQYTVNNQTYEGSNVYYWSGTGSDWSHELDSWDYSLLRDYPVGSDVRIYYNPERPDQSCLITGENPKDRSLIIGFPIIGYTILACIPLFYYADKLGKKIKKKKQESKSFTTPELIDKIKNASES